MAGVAGLEPTTPGFGDQCSSQLSYTPIAANYKFNKQNKNTQLKLGILTNLDKIILRCVQDSF